MVSTSPYCVFLWMFLHCVVEYEGVSAIQCYRCNYAVPSGNSDSNCLKNPVNKEDCPPVARSCSVTITHSEGKRDVQSVKRGCGSGDSGCSGSCSYCIKDTCYTVCNDSLCNIIDADSNGASVIGQLNRAVSKGAVSMLTLSMLILFGIKLLSNYFL